MTNSTINRLILLLSNAFKSMSLEISNPEIERMAMVVHRAMDHGRRIYHTSAHIFEICESMNPRQTLAALFHDIVYYQLDNGFPKDTENLLQNLVKTENSALILEPYTANDLSTTICASLFGFKAGDTLPLYAGMNEFFSAVLAVRLLQKHLPIKELIAISACIEATTPFRGTDERGQGFPEQLAERVRQLAKTLNIDYSDAELDAVIIDAVVFANRDVMSFSTADSDYFLSTTWQLIEESNAPLHDVGIYLITDYRNALVRMENFLRSLDPQNIFHAYADTPDKNQLGILQQAARKNIEFAVNYIGAKITGIAVIEALAIITGGDCSVSMFLGDIRSKNGKPLRIESFLPPLPAIKPFNENVMRVLEVGRAYQCGKDLTQSPLTAYICRFLGEDGISQALADARQMFAGQLTPMGFLDTLDPRLVGSVAGACAKITPSRADGLQALCLSKST